MRVVVVVVVSISHGCARQLGAATLAMQMDRWANDMWLVIPVRCRESQMIFPVRNLSVAQFHHLTLQLQLL